MKEVLLFFICIVLLTGCGKDDNPTGVDIDNPSGQFYRDFDPDVILNLNDSILIDTDNNGHDDVILKMDQYGRWADRINDSVNISMGVFIGSGSGNLDTIAYNEVIDGDTQEWYIGFNLFTKDIRYIGVRKNEEQNATYGWIAIELSDSLMTIDSYFFRKVPDAEVRAGIINQE